MISRSWAEGEWEVVFNGYGISVRGGEKVLELGSGDCCSTLWMCFMPLVKMANFIILTTV